MWIFGSSHSFPADKKIKCEQWGEIWSQEIPWDAFWCQVLTRVRQLDLFSTQSGYRAWQDTWITDTLKISRPMTWRYPLFWFILVHWQHYNVIFITQPIRLETRDCYSSIVTIRRKNVAWKATKMITPLSKYLIVDCQIW